MGGNYWLLQMLQRARGCGAGSRQLILYSHLLSPAISDILSLHRYNQ